MPKSNKLLGAKMQYTLITGACGGLGNAFIEQVAKHNLNFILAGTNNIRLATLKEELNSKYPNINIITFVCDQSDETSRNKFLDDISNYSISCAILNAGYIDEGPINKKTEQQLTSVIRTNCEGTILIAKRLFDNSIKNKTHLDLLVTSSLSAYYPMPLMAIYSASKAMILHFFLSAREEYKKYDINITVLAPSGIPTTQAMKDAIKAQGFAGKITATPPQEVAKFGLKCLNKHKPVAIPKCLNKFLCWAGTRPSKTFTAKLIYKRWQKSQTKLKLK